MLQESTLQFFRELRENNNKEWFDVNRKRYLTIKEDYLHLAGSLLVEMKKIDPTLEPLVAKDCIFRINKDIRFSKDKSPYKTNLGIILSPFGKKMNTASYYIHIEEGQNFVGGGLWMPESSQLAKIRQEINYFYQDLDKVVSEPGFKKVYGSIDTNDKIKLIRPPKGYDADHPAIEYLKLKSFTAITTFPDDILTSPKMIPYLVEKLNALKPLLIFLNRGLMSDEEGGL